MRIEGQPAGSPAEAGSEAAAPAGATGAGASTAAPAGEACPQCGAGKTGVFCEVCGFDYRSPASPAQPAHVGQPPQPAPGVSLAGSASATNVVVAAGAAGAEGEQAVASGWTAVITADRDYFDSVVAAGGPDAASIEFPSYCPERRFTLGGQEMRIGRRSASRGLEPEIDLTGPPTDPGVSHLHAVLIAQPDGTWSVLDPGSSNGTQVNGTEVATGVPVPLHPGDRVCLGAWTVLLIQQT
jgi:hypothetical protein